MKRLQGMLKTDFTPIKINFNNRRTHHVIPTEPGWYFILTNTPINVLKFVGPPPEKGNYDIPSKINAAQYLIQSGLAITQQTKELFVVYSGEAENLNSRAREHIWGGKGTGCLALSKHLSLRPYDWWFHYLPCSSYDRSCNGDKGLRVLGEQIWRSIHGWPILCSS